jgi:D-tyrosyl-tRNA(Tyr) deacylase
VTAMRVVVQRVAHASVEVEGRETGRIGRGLLLLVGMEKGDGEKEISSMADRVLHLRVFPDDAGRMNLDVREVGGGILSISQFTLAARNKKGRRPDFSNAEEPARAAALYEAFNARLAAALPVATGIFGAMMDVHSLNQGPVTIILEKSSNGMEYS